MTAEPLLPAWLGWLAVAILGWLWGSFLNQFVDRLSSTPPVPHSTRCRGGGAPAPGVRAEDPPSTFAERGDGGEVHVTLLHPPRSICLACGRPIAWHDNLPILSWLWLRGRCRRCGAPIGLRTLILEIATPLIGLAIFAGSGWSAVTVAAWAAASWGEVALAMSLERRPLPASFRLAGVAIGTLLMWAAWLDRPG